ncbi:lantibiotic immunity ABC transporter MutE/EpiE family permease subunit [Acetobacterium sp. UBA5834]|jgi:ABC-2 type transport system permease protein|uniref:lantibiotic immunity ABC transporter MutE/EpiE family permease subunit n=1 Tax=Acetobacterium sp. UBA5834 TaxID=1945907 RepID=UPI0025797759|nr:lantibiotic immunity ABC transporter MutE/EpiE family permease subunit [Acetobacterium sp. UBA5834]
MVNIIKSELIKGRRSFGRKSLVLFPSLVVLMAIVLMGGALTQVGAYNWWYMMFLPVTVALVCINLIEPDKRMQFFNVATLPVPKGRMWLAKVWTGCFYIFIGNLIVFGLTTISGLFFGSQYPIWRGLAAAFVLTIAWVWQIPLGMFLSAKLNSVVTFLGILGVNIICSIQDIAGGRFWFIPFAIPARLMASILGINPNGVLMAPDSPLHDSSVVLPGILITSVLLAVSLLLTKIWFNGRSE